MSPPVAVGIDLGTTYSAVAHVNEYGQPDILANDQNERLTPSAVFFAGDAIIVGQEAKDAAVHYPDQVALFVKRQMGNPHWYLPHRGQRYSAVDISALIVKKLKQDAEKRLTCSLPYAVITVPAYFDDVRRRFTSEAARIAGLDILDLVNEPTAAAVAFGIKHSSQHETVLVYDLGGGTFDVTIMRIDDKEFRVLASDGAHQLGGKDFDDQLIGLAVAQFAHEHGVDPTSDPVDAGELRSYAERTKRELSKRRTSMLVVRAQGHTSRIEVRREQFEDLIQPKLETTLALIRNTLKDAGLKPDQIDRVLLTGGSTRVPAVSATLTRFFGTPPDTSVDPDEAVALGAAIMAAKRMSDAPPMSTTASAGSSAPPAAPAVAEVISGLQVTDVTAHSFGIEACVPGTEQRVHSILIQRNTPLPAEESRNFATAIPNQTVIKIPIYQGEFQDLAQCNPIGDFLLSGLPPNRPAGRKVRITFACDTSGVIHVTALDIETGTETTTTVGYQVGQSPEQVSARKRWMDTQTVE